MTTPSYISNMWAGGRMPYIPPGHSIMDYGAAGDGISDDTNAIMSALTAFTSNGVPTSGARSVKGPLIFPPGTYKITSDIVWQSISEPVLLGYGATILASGPSFTNSMFYIDGCYRGIFRGFQFRGDGTEQVPSAFKLDTSTAGFRTTTGCEIADFNILNLKFVTGIDLMGTVSRQLDGTQVENCLITGQQVPGSWSNAGNWQNGIAMGNGTFGNIYNNALRSVSPSGCWVGYNCNVSSFSLDQGQPANNGTDFIINPGAQCMISNIQTQTCGLHFQIQGFSPLPVSFNSILVKSNFITDAGGIVGKVTGGPVILDNFSMTSIQINNSGTFTTGVIKLSNDGPNRIATACIRNLMANGLKTAAILPVAATGNTNVVCENYMNYSPLTNIYTTSAGDILSYYTGTAWTNIA